MMKHRTATILALAAGLLAGPLASQQGAQPTFSERIDVNVINLTVNVLDRQGRPVRGLAADEFEVRVDGAAAEISNFFAVDRQVDIAQIKRDQEIAARSGNAMPPPAAAPGEARYVAIFVDNAHIHKKNRRRVFRGVRDYLSAQTDPGTYFMVVAVRKEYEVVQAFTNSVGHVVAALDSIEKSPTEGPMHEQDQRMIIRDLASVDLAPVQSVPGSSGLNVESQSRYLLQRVRMVAEQTRRNTQSSLQALSYLIGSMSGLGERKVVLYLSDGLEMRPAEALLHAHYDRFERASDIYNFAGHLDPPTLVAQEYDLSADFEQLAAYAQAHRVILSMIDASGQEANFAGSADARLRDSDSAAVAGYRPVWSNRLDILHTQNRQSTLQLLAEETGGQVLVNTRDYADFFRTFDESLGVYYSLGFAATPESEGSRHEIVVRVTRPGLRVRHQRTFVDKTWEQRLSEQTLSRVVLGAGTNVLDFRALPGEVTVQDGRHILPIHIFVPVQGLSLIPEGDDYVANLSLAVVVKKPSGDTNPPQVFAMGLRLPRNDVDNGLIKTGEAAVRLVVDPEEQEIGIGVRDSVSGATATAAFKVDASRPPG